MRHWQCRAGSAAFAPHCHGATACPWCTSGHGRHQRYSRWNEFLPGSPQRPATAYRYRRMPLELTRQGNRPASARRRIPWGRLHSPRACASKRRDSRRKRGEHFRGYRDSLLPLQFGAWLFAVPFATSLTLWRRDSSALRRRLIIAWQTGASQRTVHCNIGQRRGDTFADLQ